MTIRFLIDAERLVCIQAFGGMFCLSGLLGMYGSCATMAGYCMSRYFRVAGINVFKLKVSFASARKSSFISSCNTLLQQHAPLIPAVPIKDAQMC